MAIKKFDYEYVPYEELYQAYINCRKRKRTTINAMNFEINETKELYKLWYELNTNTYKVGKSIAFCVDRPVKREVFAADFRDRIVHHLLIDRILPFLENEFIKDSYSCRVGKGTLYGVKQCEKYIIEASENFTKNCVIVKCDLKSFFMTINKQHLFDKLVNFYKTQCKFNNENDLLFNIHLTKLIIFNEPQKNCILKQHISHWKDLPKEKSLFSIGNDVGLPIGNLTSQLFANFYLSEFDHFVNDELGIKYYGRYVDDFFLIVNNTQDANDVLKCIKEKLLSLGVTLHPKKLYIQDIKKGIKFIGSVIKPNRKYIANRTKGNFFTKILNINKEYENKKVIYEKEIKEQINSINSYLGFMKPFKTFKIKKKYLNMLCENFKKCIKINETYSKVSINKDYFMHKIKIF